MGLESGSPVPSSPTEASPPSTWFTVTVVPGVSVPPMRLHQMVQSILPSRVRSDLSASDRVHASAHSPLRHRHALHPFEMSNKPHVNRQVEVFHQDRPCRSSTTFTSAATCWQAGEDHVRLERGVRQSAWTVGVRRPPSQSIDSLSGLVSRHCPSSPVSSECPRRRPAQIVPKVGRQLGADAGVVIRWSIVRVGPHIGAILVLQTLNERQVKRGRTDVDASRWR